MAIVYSYPEGTPTLSDTVLGTQFDNNGNPTKSFSISDIIALVPSTAGFVPYTGATQSVDLGAFDLTATSIIKAGGTSVQYLMADGSISTAPSLTGFVPYVGATQNVNLGSFNLTATSIIKAGGTNLQYLLADGSVTTGPVLTGFVPYTGATQAVNLGAFNLTVNSISIGRGGGGLASNTVLGNSALSANVTGTQITAIGNLALNSNTANNNTAVGFKAMTTNTTGNTNTSVGSESLQTNLSGNENSAFGYRALYLATSAVKNNAFGRLALGNILTGNQNIGIGNNAGLLTAAANQNTTGDFSIYIGNDTKPSLDNNQNEIVIGYDANGIGSNSVVLGNTNILTTRLRGAVQGGSFVKDGGTAIQYLMADGSISTNGTLYSVVSTTYQTVAGALQSISSAIPSAIFTSGNLLKLNAVITTTAVNVAIATIEFYINSAATTVGATLIGRYNGPIGNQYIPIDRFFWVSGTTLYGKDFTASFSTSTSNSAFAINSVAIPATQFYIIAQVTTTSTDRACISSFQIEKS